MKAIHPQSAGKLEETCSIYSFFFFFLQKETQEIAIRN